MRLNTSTNVFTKEGELYLLDMETIKPLCSDDTLVLTQHVVISVGGGILWVITSYYPTSEKWESDYKTKKAVK